MMLNSKSIGGCQHLLAWACWVHFYYDEYTSIQERLLADNIGPKYECGSRAGGGLLVAVVETARASLSASRVNQKATSTSTSRLSSLYIIIHFSQAIYSAGCARCRLVYHDIEKPTAIKSSIPGARHGEVVISKCHLSPEGIRLLALP
jgi:hypothetical protein